MDNGLDRGLRDRVAVVTGANNPYGIGAAVAKALTAAGVRVFLHYFRRRPAVSVDSSAPSDLLRGEQIGAGRLHPKCSSRARPIWDYGQHGLPGSHPDGVDHTRARKRARSQERTGTDRDLG